MDSSSHTVYQKQKVKEQRCYSAPYVQCGQSTRNWTPLWNMRIHAKHTFDYESAPCDCNDVRRGKTIIGFINNTDFHWKPSVHCMECFITALCIPFSLVVDVHCCGLCRLFLISTFFSPFW
jgi:hypothetical protein